VLEKERGGDGSVPRVHVNGGPVLGGRQEDFGEAAIVKAAGAGRIPDATVLKIKQFVAAAVREAPTF
jgi:hypothetical protein